MNSFVNESRVRLMDFAPHTENFREDFCQGLRRHPRMIPPKYFYDTTGSRLFERICETPEYFVTRVEKALLRRHLDEICRLIGPDARLVEFGSGNSEKTCLLLNRLASLAAYVPIDISRDHLLASAERLADANPDVEILPVCADYTAHFEIPFPDRPFRRTVFFFPGSTIGNMTSDEALCFLRRVAAELEPGDGFLIGIALQTDPQVLERAYNDASGVTAEFNLNLLHRACEELGVEMDVAGFGHEAIYDAEQARIEMRLVSRGTQVVRVGTELFLFREGEYVVTEYSHKFTDAGFRRMSEQAGFCPSRSWSDAQKRMSLHYLSRR